MIRLAFWKYASILLMLYVLIGGILIKVPGDVGMLDQTIRNLFYHVPMWFSMMLLLLGSWILSMMYLATSKLHYHRWAASLAHTGLLAGFCGIFTGMLWASVTWGAPWTRDPKLNGAAVGILIYIGYWMLRKSVANQATNRKLSAVYNVFVYPIFIALILIMPKLSNFSVHPGSGDTVGFNQYDLNNNMRLVFYPAIIAWTLFFLWITELRVRIVNLRCADQFMNEQEEHLIE
jgi:heme exporter protein C